MIRYKLLSREEALEQLESYYETMDDNSETYILQVDFGASVK